MLLRSTVFSTAAAVIRFSVIKKNQAAVQHAVINFSLEMAFYTKLKRERMKLMAEVIRNPFFFFFRFQIELEASRHQNPVYR